MYNYCNKGAKWCLFVSNGHGIDYSSNKVKDWDDLGTVHDELMHTVMVLL